MYEEVLVEIHHYKDATTMICVVTVSVLLVATDYLQRKGDSKAREVLFLKILRRKEETKRGWSNIVRAQESKNYMVGSLN